MWFGGRNYMSLGRRYLNHSGQARKEEQTASITVKRSDECTSPGHVEMPRACEHVRFSKEHRRRRH